MENAKQSSITEWIEHVKQHDQSAQQRVMERLFDRLEKYSQTVLRRCGVHSVDGEDIASMSFHNLFSSVGSFSKLVDRNDLWKILVLCAERRVIDQLRKEQSQRRGEGRVIIESDLGEAGDGLPDATRYTFNQPDVELVLAEEFRKRLDMLDDDNQRAITIGRMQGFKNAEIAEKLGLSLRSVERKLGRIREILSIYVG